MNQAKILIVEDEFVVADDIEARLLDMGYAVAGKAASGDEAIAFAEALPLDLVLMDIHLRGPMDGITAATEIRQRFKLPVVFLIHREFPRLCRGGIRSLTNTGVHPRNSRREPPSTRKGEPGWTSMRA
jgi:CheY-like chemotaxis protein